MYFCGMSDILTTVQLNRRLLISSSFALSDGALSNSGCGILNTPSALIHVTRDPFMIATRTAEHSYLLLSFVRIDNISFRIYCVKYVWWLST